MTKEEIIALCKAGNIPYKEWQSESGAYFVQIDGWNSVISIGGEDAAWDTAWERRAKSSQSWQEFTKTL